MGSPRDMQHNIAAWAAESVTVPVATGLIRTTSIDTQGFNRVMASLKPTNAIGSDQIKYTFEESDDNTNWNDVPDVGHLPTNKNNARLLEDANSPYLQTIGCISEKRYLRIRFNSLVLTVANPVAVNQMAISKLRPFEGWTTPATDGLP